jgi:hypothetical protein
MNTVLLKNNPRAASLLVALWTLLLVIVVVYVRIPFHRGISIITIVAALGVLGIGGLAGQQMRWAWTPRLAYTPGHLLVFLSGLRPIGVPIELVECFFLGEAPSLIASRAGRQIKSVTLVVRLAERSKELRQRDVWPWLGQWRDGYITIRGTWCEPLSREIVNRLNSQLAEIKHRQRAAAL